LQKEVDSKIQTLGSRANNANVLLNYLYQHPIIEAQKAKEVTGLSLPSVYKLLEELENLKIINEITGSKRGKLYLFRDYTRLFQ
jgi:Fic family protein